jgi:hypothetical protein
MFNELCVHQSQLPKNSKLLLMWIFEIKGENSNVQKVDNSRVQLGSDLHLNFDDLLII